MSAASVSVPGSGVVSTLPMVQCRTISPTTGPILAGDRSTSNSLPTEQQTSMDPKYYTWGNPSQEQQQRLFQQFMQIAMFQQAALQQRGMPGQPPVPPFPFFPGFCSMPVPPGFGGMFPFFPGMPPYMQQTVAASGAKVAGQNDQASGASGPSVQPQLPQVPCSFMPCFPFSPFPPHLMMLPNGTHAGTSSASTAAPAGSAAPSAAATPAATAAMLAFNPVVPPAAMPPLLPPGCIMPIPAAAVAATSSFCPPPTAAAAPVTTTTSPAAATAGVAATAAVQPVQQLQKQGAVAGSVASAAHPTAPNLAAAGSVAGTALSAASPAPGELELPELQCLLNDVQPHASAEADTQRARSPPSSSSGTAPASGISSGAAGGSCNSLATCDTTATGMELGNLAMPDLDLALQEALDIDLAQLFGEQGFEELKQQDLNRGRGLQEQQKLELAKSNSMDSSTIALAGLPEVDNKQGAGAAAGAAAASVAAAKAAAKASKPRAPKPKKAAKAAAAAGAAPGGATLKAQGGVAKPPRKLTITLKQQSQQAQQQQKQHQPSTVPRPAGVAAPQTCSSPCPDGEELAEAPAAVAVSSPDSGFSSACDLATIPLSPLGMSEEDSGSMGYSFMEDVMGAITFENICGAEDACWSDLLDL